MPEVISDTSPLQYLYQVEQLDLLPALYGKVLVPEGVAVEIKAGQALGHSLPDLQALDWIQIATVPHPRTLLLAADLGKGEREVLSLATQRPGTTVLLDDGLARRMARHLGLPFTGTLGVLLRAKAAGHLGAIGPTIDSLQAHGFRLDGLTRTAVLELAQEA